MSDSYFYEWLFGARKTFRAFEKRATDSKNYKAPDPMSCERRLSLCFQFFCFSVLFNGCLSF